VAWPKLGPAAWLGRRLPAGLRLGAGAVVHDASSSDGGDNSAQRSSVEEDGSGSGFGEEGRGAEAASAEEKMEEARATRS
jgi:hypothetical protein